MTEWHPIEDLRDGIFVLLWWPAAGRAVFIGSRNRGNIYYFSYAEGKAIKASRDVLDWQWAYLPKPPVKSRRG